MTVPLRVNDPVIVDVAPEGAGGEGELVKASARAHIGESPIAIITE